MPSSTQVGAIFFAFFVSSAFVTASYCTTDALSKRDCDLCKIQYMYEERKCTRAKGPCIWNVTDVYEDSPHNLAECEALKGGGGDDSGGGGGGRPAGKGPERRLLRK